MASIGSVAKRVPNPKTNSIGQVSSKAVAKYAAISGEITGTLYSYLNRAIVEDQLDIFVRPEYQNILAIHRRMISTNADIPKYINISVIFV